jgi:P27 family predicted phage terminase small subunit
MAGTRKSSAELRLQGSYRKDRHAPRDRAPAGGAEITSATPAPQHLSPAVAHVWREVVALLPDRLARQADALLLESLASALHMHREAARVLAVEGPSCTGSMGQATQHWAWKTQTQAALIVAKLCGELGLSPQARLRLADGPPAEHAAPDPSDPWSQFEAAIAAASGPRPDPKATKRRRSDA